MEFTKFHISWQQKRRSLSAKEALDVAPRLYEKKLTSYPRSDCHYLLEEQFDDAKPIIKALSSASVFEAANQELKSKAWYTKKIPHTALSRLEKLRQIFLQEEAKLSS